MLIFEKKIKPSEDLYYRFRIKKRNGGFRDIISPKKQLKSIQKIIFNEILKKIKVSNFAYGFREGFSIVSNAINHLNSKIIYKVDLKDFFPSIKFSRVLNIFKKVGYSGQTSTILTMLCTYSERKNNGKELIALKKERCLPQGACTSPIISNIVCYELDIKLNNIAKNYGFTYSRYADDLTFSSSRINYISQIFTRKINQCIIKMGFKANKSKIRKSKNYKRQIVTGIIVNNKETALPKEWIKNLRSALYHLKNSEYKNQDELLKDINNIEGRCAYAKMVNNKKYLKYYYEFANLKNQIFKRIKNNN